MLELADRLSDEVEPELWSGAAVSERVRRPKYHLHAWGRDKLWRTGLSWSRRYHLEQLSVLPWALRLLRRRQPDLVYCGDPALTWHLKRFSRWHGARIVFMNGMNLSPVWASAFDGIHVLAPPYLLQAREALAPAMAARFFMVPHFVDLERFHPAGLEERLRVRRELSISETAFIVLSVGPIGTESGKRLEYLLGELAQLPPDCHVLCVGADEPGAEVVRQAASALGARVRFMGAVERSRMPLIYRAVDVFALCALREPFSIALLEAMATALPVVHHEDEVRAWMVGDAGMKVDMQEPGAAASALLQLRRSAELRRELGLRGRRLAEQRYHPEQVCRDLIQAWLQICRTDRS